MSHFAIQWPAFTGSLRQSAPSLILLGTLFLSGAAQAQELSMVPQQFVGDDGADVIVVDGLIDENGELIVDTVYPAGTDAGLSPQANYIANPGPVAVEASLPATAGSEDYITVEMPQGMEMYDPAGVAMFDSQQPQFIDVILDGEPGNEQIVDVVSWNADSSLNGFDGPIQLVVQEENPPLPRAHNTNNQNQNNNESYGQEPVDTSYAFLRRVSPLLDRGECQFDCGIIYSLFENDLPFLVDVVPDPDVVVEGRLRSRLITVPFAIRYGVSDDTQVFINIPVGYNHNEVSLPGFDVFGEEAGIGDITVGATYLLGDPCPGDPDVIGTVALTIPTGNARFASVLQQPGAQLGTGHFAITANLLCIHTVDPLIVFYGFGARAPFSNKFSNSTIDVQPGIQANYRFGVGFAVNDRVTLSTALLGSYITDTRVNGHRLENSSLEPIVMRFAATMADGDRIQEPFVEVGLTDDSSSATLGWVVTY